MPCRPPEHGSVGLVTLDVVHRSRVAVPSLPKCLTTLELIHPFSYGSPPLHIGSSGGPESRCLRPVLLRLGRGASTSAPSPTSTATTPATSKTPSMPFHLLPNDETSSLVDLGYHS